MGGGVAGLMATLDGSLLTRTIPCVKPSATVENFVPKTGVGATEKPQKEQELDWNPYRRGGERRR